MPTVIPETWKVIALSLGLISMAYGWWQVRWKSRFRGFGWPQFVLGFLSLIFGAIVFFTSLAQF